MSSRVNPLAAYGRVANAETNPLQQIIMLYDGAVKFLRLAAADMMVGDLPAKAEHTNRALDIITYLQSILDFERGGDVAPALDLFYTSLMLQILKASAALDSVQMGQAAELLQPVRDAWAAQAPASAPAFAAAGVPSFAGSHQLIA
ncbi:MAG: flagellar export chaperone FliS [Blastocatellia bacterium]|nr:flagellar export chaperone FliS [Blastocatellia bacterium]